MPRAKKENPKLNMEISAVDEVFLETDDRLRSLRLEQDTISERIAKLEMALSEENAHKDPNRNLFHVAANVEFEAASDDIRRELYLVNEKKQNVDNQIDCLMQRLDGLHKVKKILYKLDEPSSENETESNKEQGSIVLSSDVTSILHDDCIQSIVGAISKLELSERLLDFDPTRAHHEILGVEEILKQTVSFLREAIYEVRPMTLSDIGFWESVNELLEKTKQTYGIQTRLDISDDASDFSPEKENAVSVFKVIQEVLFESCNHTDATRVIISADRDNDNIIISIKDDGSSSSSEAELSIVEKKVKLLNGKMENISKKRGNEILISLQTDWGSK